jgi:hypothetical protein
LLQFEVIPKERVLFLNMHRFVQYFLFWWQFSISYVKNVFH